MTRSCSSWSSVGDSPVVPTGDRQSVPCCTCQSTSRFSSPKSITPSRKGVTRATVTPANCSPFVFIHGLLTLHHVAPGCKEKIRKSQVDVARRRASLLREPQQYSPTSNE